jgi:hypothetical protein
VLLGHYFLAVLSFSSALAASEAILCFLLSPSQLYFHILSASGELCPCSLEQLNLMLWLACVADFGQFGCNLLNLQPGFNKPFLHSFQFLLNLEEL